MSKKMVLLYFSINTYTAVATSTLELLVLLCRLKTVSNLDPFSTAAPMPLGKNYLELVLDRFCSSNGVITLSEPGDGHEQFGTMYQPLTSRVSAQ